jgi:hypothetical protein
VPLRQLHDSPAQRPIAIRSWLVPQRAGADLRYPQTAPL